jgi:hypothetical protein
VLKTGNTLRLNLVICLGSSSKAIEIHEKSCKLELPVCDRRVPCHGSVDNIFFLELKKTMKKKVQ